MGFLPSQILRRIVTRPNLAVDIGTATTRISTTGREIALERPSIAPATRRTKSPQTKTSDEAGSRGVCGTENVSFPLRGGVVIDCEGAAWVLQSLFRRIRKFGMRRPSVLACAPTDASPEERDALVRALRMAGASHIDIVPEPLAAAVGAKLQIQSACPKMIIDIGEGVTDIAIIKSGTLLHASAIRVACNDLHETVQAAVLSQGPVLSMVEAGRVTRIIGALFPENLPKQLSLLIAGPHGTGERLVMIDTEPLWNALDPVYQSIIAHIKRTFQDLPIAIRDQIKESTICLTGGGALLRGVSWRVAAEIKVRVQVPEYPMDTVIDGARKLLLNRVETSAWRN